MERSPFELSASRAQESSSSSNSSLESKPGLIPPLLLKSPSRSTGTEDSLRSAGSLGAPLSPREMEIVNIPFEKIQFCLDEHGERVRLGNGACGSIYEVLLEGVQPLAAREVALGGSSNTAEFIRVAGLLWRLRHRNTVALNGISFSEDKGYLLMELVEGGTLAARREALDEATGQRLYGWYNKGQEIAVSVAAALHYLHSLRIPDEFAHLKSSNVLLSSHPPGRGFTAKLGDIGLARVMACTQQTSSYEKDSATLAYMAPELLAGSKCTAAVDIYAWGVLLFEICSGKPPSRAAMSAEPCVPQDCPQAVADLWRQCIAGAPAARPTARELLEHLRQLESTGSPPQEGSSAAATTGWRQAGMLHASELQEVAASPFAALAGLEFQPAQRGPSA